MTVKKIIFPPPPFYKDQEGRLVGFDEREVWRWFEKVSDILNDHEDRIATLEP